jgi:hypothetical protein
MLKAAIGGGLGSEKWEIESGKRFSLFMILRIEL